MPNFHFVLDMSRLPLIVNREGGKAGLTCDILTDPLTAYQLYNITTDKITFN